MSTVDVAAAIAKWEADMAQRDTDLRTAGNLLEMDGTHGRFVAEKDGQLVKVREGAFDLLTNDERKIVVPWARGVARVIHADGTQTDRGW
jgi:hypothetical protein